MLNRKYVIIASIFILICGLFLTTLFNIENQMEKSGGIVLNGSNFSNGQQDLTARIMDSGDKKIDTYSTSISGDDFQKTEDDNFHVVIYHLNAQAYAVYFNGKHIGTAGDINNARSNTYSSIKDFVIQKDDVADENILEIRTHSLYMTGLEQHPIGIVSCETARKITGRIAFLSEGLNMIGVGILFLGAIIAFVMILLSEKKNRGMVFLLVAVICFIVFSIEFRGILHLPFDFIVYKKIIMLSLFACMFFLGLSVMYFLDSKVSTLVSSLTFLIIIVCVIFVNDMILFKNIYTVLIIGLGVNFLIWTMAALRDYKTRDESVIFTYGMANFFIMALLDSIALIVIGGSANNSIIMYALIFSTILISLFYLEIARRNIRIYTESSQRHHFYKQAITDSLTGAYEKNYAISTITDGESFTIAMIDIDHFKPLNDTYGHPAGDYILKQLVRIMREEFRESDVIARYGGDEFIIGLRGCSIEDAFSIMEKFRIKVEEESFTYSDKKIPVTISVGLNFYDGREKNSRTVERADEALYRAKEAGRNRVSL